MTKKIVYWFMAIVIVFLIGIVVGLKKQAIYLEYQSELQYRNLLIQKNQLKELKINNDMLYKIILENEKNKLPSMKY